MQEKLKQLKELRDLVEKYSYAIFIMSFDAVTDCPKNDREHANEVMEFFEQKILDIELSDKYSQLIEDLYQNREDLDEISRLDIEIEHKALAKMKKIPVDELNKHIANENRAGLEWANARDTMDYSAFMVELKELVDYYKKYCVWQETENRKGYDVLLDDMEEGYTRKMYDEFFDLIEKELVPYIRTILDKPQKYNPKLDERMFDISKQKELTRIIADAMGYDDTVGCIRETIHPFTNYANINDVRITTNYHKDRLISNLYSIMHEIGHAMFQIQSDPKYDHTNIFNNISCITHESMSRFYENYLGRRRAFVSYLYPILKELYPQELNDITEDDIYYYVNSPKAQLTRIEADELTYPIHILIRYNVEKKLFDNEMDETGMEIEFNKEMEKYLGIVPANMKEGVFQDSHWSSNFGYFPTYALGSAYGAMYLEEMMKDVDVDKDLSEGNFQNINKWLKEKIHQYSGTRNNLKVIEEVCHREFDPQVYIDYLKKKYDEIYK